VQTTIEGYIIEFFVKGHQSFSKAEVVFKSRLGERLLKEILLWIKFLMLEERLLVFQGPPMAA